MNYHWTSFEIKFLSILAPLRQGEQDEIRNFRLFKESKTQIHPTINVLTDSGYQGLQKIHSKTQMPKKRSKKNPLTQEDKKSNRQLSSDRVLNENVIGNLKRFKIISDRYRNRRKRFSLRFNLIAGIYNLELNSINPQLASGL